MEIAESEQRKNLLKSPDLVTYTKLLSLLHKNYEISTLTANELSSHLDLLNLSIVSAVIQKIVRGYQTQLNMFLHFQLNFIKKMNAKKDISANSNTLLPEAELISLGSASNINLLIDEKKVDLKNKNIRRYSNANANFIKKPRKSNFDMVSPSIFVSNTGSIESLDQNMQDLDSWMQKQETHLYNLNLIEQRNVANNSELRELSRNINKKVKQSISPGETSPLIPLKIVDEEEKFSQEIKKKSSLKKHKKRKETIIKRNISEILEESQENGASPTNSKRMTKKEMTKMSIIGKAHTKTQGTNPDPDIFDINIIYALEEIIKHRDLSLEELQENIYHREQNIKELESLNSFLKSDYNTLKSNYETLNIKFAEVKVLEANLNIDLSTMKKEVNSLKKELGVWEMKYEQKDHEVFNIRNNLESQKAEIAEKEQKIQELSKEIESLKENKAILEAKNQTLKEKNQSFEEINEHLRAEIEELKQNSKKNVQNVEEVKQFYEELLNNLEENKREIEKHNENINQELFQLKHFLEMKNIEKDSDYLNLLEKTRKNSLSNTNNSEKYQNNFSQKLKINQTNDANQNIFGKKLILSENVDENKEKLKEKTGNISENSKKPDISPRNYEHSNIFNKLMKISQFTQTEMFDIDEFLKEYLRIKRIFPIYWPEIFDFIENISKKNSILFNPKKNSRKNSFSSVNTTNYQEIMKGNLSPLNKFNFYYEKNGNLANNATQLKENANLSNENLNFLPANIQNNNNFSSVSFHQTTNFVKNPKINMTNREKPPNYENLTGLTNTNLQNHENMQFHRMPSLSNLSNLDLSPRNITQSPQLPHSQSTKNPQNSKFFSGSSALKQHLKGSASTILRQNFKEKDILPIKSEENGQENIIFNEFPMKKAKHLSASSSNLLGELIKTGEKNEFLEEKEKNYQKNHDLWELSREEKEKVFQKMYIGFNKLQENLLSSQKEHKKFLRHVALIKHIKKEVNGNFDGDIQMPNFEEFKEFLERMLNQHKKCGKECSHLKRFYEKIGYLPTEKNSSYANRVPFNPKKMIINSLPKIQNL